MTFRTPGFGRRLGTGRTRLLLPVLVALAVLLVAFLVFTSIWTNLLWYRSLGYSSVYTTELWAKSLLFLGSGALMAVVVGANVVVAYRLRPAYRPLSVEQQGLERYRAVVDPRRRLIAGGLLGMLALLTGSSVAGQWPVFLAFLNRTSFGVKDPQFGKDVSFYVFTYPFLRLVLGVVFATVILSILAAVIVHYLYGGLRLQGPGDKASPPTRAHLSVLVGVFVLLKAFAYWFDRYGLAQSERGVVTGASYTDVNALLPAKTILSVIALICAVLFFSNLLRRGMMMPGVGFTLLVLSAVLVGGVYPLLIQQFQVKPDELAKERKFIERNIAFTRKAYGVENVKPESYGATPTTDEKQLSGQAKQLETDGVRLLDPNVVGEAFQRLQQGRDFYKFPDALDVDRYKVDGKTVDSIVALREITGAPATQRSWVKDRMVYTHGYGFVSAYGDRVEAEGNPSFLTKDMPVATDSKIGIKQPQIYFGERSQDYSVVGGKGQEELDYPDDKSVGGQKYTSYTGKRGIAIDSFFNKLLYATKFQDKNLLLSGAIKPGAKILYDRAPRQMVKKAAPWLTIDGDPYPAVVDGKIMWIIDGYTTSAGFPYSEKMSLGDATRDTITDTRTAVAKQTNDRINYMRNSVKATVDAYDGTVKLYEWDQSDPVLKTWRKVFKNTVEPKSEIDKVPGLKEHFRYPLDLFKVQRRILAKYHVTQPDPFFNGEGFWSVPEDPSNKGNTQPPYYQQVRMPGGGDPQFSLTSVFTPRKRGNLAAFMAADTSSDPARIRLLELPRNSLLDGPELVQGKFATDTKVQDQLLSLKQSGTNLVNGNLLTLPFGGGIMYIEPVYAKVSGGTGQQPYPSLRKVMVSYSGRIAAANTLSEALAEIFKPTGATPPPKQGDKPPQQNTQLTPEVQKAITELQTAVTDYEKAQREGNYPEMGKAWDRIKKARDALATAQAAPTTKPTGTPTPSPSATPTN
ncbi:UPF0182 family membrane protein [Spirillospora sp. CA-294931]|uniref:UPF0182 family membrane protein n=1 Tax=Spirillospora sp. CA-294931 TaxID=3240042 RepID=UPI003D8FC32E